MSKVITFLAVAVLSFSPVSAFAAMNYTGTGYKVPPNCTVGDNNLSEYIDGKYVVTGCWTQEAMKASADAAAKRTYGFKVGTTLTLRMGVVECPLWFNLNSGCVVDPVFLLQGGANY